MQESYILPIIDIMVSNLSAVIDLIFI